MSHFINYVIGIPYYYYLISAAVAVIWWLRNRTLPVGRRLAWSAFGAYVFLILAESVLRRSAAETAAYDLTPFWSYAAVFSGDTSVLPQMIGNVVAFMPFGFLLPTANEKYSFRTTVLFGLGFSVFIEVMQLVTKRGFAEFDDIFHNVLGTVIGCGLWKLAHRLFGDRTDTTE